jgi:hypothetical protein
MRREREETFSDPAKMPEEFAYRSPVFGSDSVASLFTRR